MAPVQLFLRGIQGNTQAVWACPDQSVLELKGAVEEKEGIPWHCQGLVFQGRQLQDELPLFSYGISAQSTVHLVLALRGGKGGFGALLRGQGRDGKVTTNFDACRDLSGRRVRHTTIENKLKDWKASAPERDLEKLAEQHIRDLARQQRREQAEEVDIEPLLNEHEEVVEESRRAVQEAIASGHHRHHNHTHALHSSKRAGEGASTSAAAHVSGLQGEASATAGTGKRGLESGDDSARGVGGGLSQPQAKVAAPPAKKPKMLAMLEDLGSSDEDDSESDDSNEEGATHV